MLRALLFDGVGDIYFLERTMPFHARTRYEEETEL